MRNFRLYLKPLKISLNRDIPINKGLKMDIFYVKNVPFEIQVSRFRPEFQLLVSVQYFCQNNSMYPPVPGTPGIRYPVPPLLRIEYKMSKTAILLVKHENAKL